MTLDPFRLPYRAPILEDLPTTLLAVMEALPLSDAMRLARVAPNYHRESRDSRTGRPHAQTCAFLYLPEVKNLTPEHRLVRTLGMEKARRLAAVRGGSHWSAPLAGLAPRVARIRQAFDLLDMGAGDLQIAHRLSVTGRYARDLEDVLSMWRGGSEPAAIRAGGGCSRRGLALALAHDLNRPGGVPAGLEELEPPRVPPLESLPGDLPELVAAVGMRDALTLTHVAEGMGRRAAVRLADSLGVGRLKPQPLRDLSAALRVRRALDLWQLGYTAGEINATANPQGGGLKGWLRAADAWRKGADIAEAAKAGGVAPSRLALALWREW